MIKPTKSLLYTPQQVNALTGIATPTLRFWEKSFSKLFNIQRTPKGQRRYTIQDVETFKEVRRLLKDIGYKSEGAYKVILEEQQIMLNQQKEEKP